MKFTASADQVVIAREAARRVLVAHSDQSKRTMRRHLKTEISRYGSAAMFILLFRLAWFILEWYLSSKISEPSAVMTSNEPWAGQDKFEFESEDEDA